MNAVELHRVLMVRAGGRCEVVRRVGFSSARCAAVRDLVAVPNDAEIDPLGPTAARLGPDDLMVACPECLDEWAPWADLLGVLSGGGR